MVRKLAVVVLAVAMVMSCMGLASAATFPDTAGHKQEAAIGRLTSLGLLKGYPDGTFKPDAPITRAEFAKVIVCALGLETAADMMATTPTVFPDVPVGYWATGYINVASSQGIVNGYPDGTFGPNNNVTYAEALKMILCALGYTPDRLRNVVWPITWVAKAQELGVTDGVPLATGAVNLPAARADVARLVDNALDVPKLVQWTYGDEVTYVPSDRTGGEVQTLLKDLGCTEVKDAVVLDAGVLLDSKLAADEIKVREEGKDPATYTLKDPSVDPRSLVGLTIDAWVNEDGEIIAMSSTNADDVETGMVPRVTVTGNPATGTVQIGKADDYDVYNLTEDTVVFLNQETSSVALLGAYVVNAEASSNDDYIYARFIRDGKDIEMIDVIDYGNPMIVDEVNTRYSRIYLKSWVSGTASRVEYEDIDLTVTRDGEPAEVTDLEENDVIYVWVNDDEEKMIIEAFSGKATGEMEAAHVDWKNVTVDGTKYNLIPKVDAAVSTDGGDSFDLWADDSAVSDMLGTEVTLLLGFNGKVVAIAGQPEEPVTVANYALVYDVVEDDFGDVYVRLVTSEGTKKDVEVKSSTEINDEALGSGFTVTSVVYAIEDAGWTELPVYDGKQLDTVYLTTFKLTSDGYLASLGPVEDDVVSDTDGVYLYKDYSRVKVGSTTSVVKSSTVILDASAFPTVNVVNYGSVEKDASYDGVLVDDSGNAVLVVLTEKPSVVADVGVITAKSLVAGGYKITVDLAGTVESYTFDLDDVTVESLEESNWGDDSSTMADIDVGDMVQLGYDSSGDLDSITEVQAGVASVTEVVYGEVASVDASAIKVKVGTVTYFGDEDTVVYDCRPDVPEKVEFSAIRRGDSVQLFLDEGVIKYVKLVDPEDLP